MDTDVMQFTELAEILKALAHPVRLCIVKGLMENGSCNVSHIHNCLNAPQSTISQHLQKLRSMGIIHGTRTGLEIKYTVGDEKIRQIMSALFAVSKPKPNLR